MPTARIRARRAGRFHTGPFRTGQAGVLALVAATLTAASARPNPFLAPGPLPALAATTLDARFAANRQAIEQARDIAEQAGDHGRERALAGLLRPDRRFLSFDPRGTGQAVEVIGDLTRARRIAVVVPGSDGSLWTFDGWKFAGGGARALHDQARRLSPGAPGAGSRLAVIAWLGYEPPRTISADVLTDGRARRAAGGLRRFLTELRRVNGTADIGLLCHSYGTVVCGAAANGLAVDDIALYGSPGVPAGSVAALRTPARVWAGRARGDWMAYVPHVRVFRLGFGTDPVSPAFGARVFDAGPGGHGDYLRPGSVSLRNLALIALGRGSEVTHA